MSYVNQYLIKHKKIIKNNKNKKYFIIKFYFHRQKTQSKKTKIQIFLY